MTHTRLPGSTADAGVADAGVADAGVDVDNADEVDLFGLQ